MYNLNFVTPIL